MLQYFAGLNVSRKVLWCYLFWWLHTVAHHFDPSPWLWINSLGISGIVGTALLLSTRNSSTGVTRLDGWQIFRLYLMPFCVSSFAALVKSAGFILVFPSSGTELLSGLGGIVFFLALTWVLGRVISPRV
ncbi:hypothetical protein BH11VER1_BH11VER1_20130 [soil metagenome]